MFSDTFDQLKRVTQQLIDELEQEKAEIMALQRAVQTREGEVNRRNEELIAERNRVLLMVDSAKEEKEAYEDKTNELIKTKAVLASQIKENEEFADELDKREKAIERKEEEAKTLEDREQVLKDGILTLNSDREFITKQKELLNEKSKVLDLRETQLEQREAKVQRLYQ